MWFLAPLSFGFGLFDMCVVRAPLVQDSTATKSAFVLLRFRNSKEAVDTRAVNDALSALHPSMALRLRLTPRALAWAYLGVHLTMSSFESSLRFVVSSMNFCVGWICLICLVAFAGVLRCRGQRHQGSPHSQVHCFVGRETLHDPDQRGLAKEFSWYMVAFANLA